MRLNYNAETLEEITEYYDTRARQLLHANVIWLKKIQPVEDWGYKTWFNYQGNKYESFYLKQSQRGKGLFTKYLRFRAEDPILTSSSCLLFYAREVTLI